MKISVEKLGLLINAISDFQVKTKIRIPILLTAVHGVGKTQCVSKIPGFNAEIVNLSCAGDPGELIGLPETSVDSKGRKFTEWAKPSWLMDGLDHPKTIFFLDEMNRGEDIIQQTMLPFTIEGRLHTHTIRDQDVIIAAINPDNGSYTVNDFSDEALIDRFLHFGFSPTNKEYITFLQGSEHCNGALLDLIDECGQDIIDVENPNIKYNKSPSRRAKYNVACFATYLNEAGIYDKLGHEVCMVGMGPELGPRFHALNKDAQKGVKLEDILRGRLPKDFSKEEVERYSNALDALGTHIAKAFKLEKESDKSSGIFDMTEKEKINIANFFNKISADTVHGLIGGQIRATIKNRLASDELPNGLECGAIISNFICIMDKILSDSYGFERTLQERVLKNGINKGAKAKKK